MSPLLGLDYGKRRIGVAASNAGETLAFAVGTHVAGRDGSILTYLGELITDRDVTGLVLGLPLRTDGSEGETAATVRRFAEKLRRAFALPVHFQDERYTSSEAADYLRPVKKRRKEDVDAVAAEIILQCFLDQRRACGPAGEGASDVDPA